MVVIHYGLLNGSSLYTVYRVDERYVHVCFGYLLLTDAKIQLSLLSISDG